MMSYTLEEDIPDEFKGGKLEINDEEIKFELNKEVLQNNNVETQPSTTSTIWKDNIVPITQKIVETIKSKKTETQNSCMTVATVQESASDFFTFRESIVSNAIKECIKEYIQVETDGQFVASFLLTEINLWDSDKERLVLLTERFLFNIKYDFIALKKLDCKKIPLLNVDDIVIGDLIYPNGSFVPDRNTRGIRLMWNKGKPLDFTTKWNPFTNDVPFCTFTTHPLSYHPECTIDQRKFYDLDEFTEKLREIVGVLQQKQDMRCLIHHNNIVLQNYIGLSSFIHNKNSLGFFKVRGKFSF